MQLCVEQFHTDQNTMIFMFIYSFLTSKQLQQVNISCNTDTVIIQWNKHGLFLLSYVIISCSTLTIWHQWLLIHLIFYPGRKTNQTCKASFGLWKCPCRGSVMAAFLTLGNWPSHESVERYLFSFHCSIRLCMNFFHLLAYWANSSLNAKVFIMAMESGLARGHPWCSTGCLGKTGIRKRPQSQATATNRAEWLQSPL